MTRVTRQRTTTRVPAQRNSVLDQPPRDYRTLPDSPMRRRFTASRPSTQTTEIIPVVEDTVVMCAVRAAAPPSEAALSNDRMSDVDPADIAFWRRAGQRMFMVLLPPRRRTYQGGISDLPAPSLWDRRHDTDDWPDQEVPRGRRGRRSPVVDADCDTPRSLPVAHIRDAARALHPAPRTGSADPMRLADEAARANDDRMARFTAQADGWLDGYDARVRGFKQRLSEAKAQADAAEIARRVANEDAAHPAACDTMAAGMFEAAKMRADLDAMLAANPAVSA